MALTRKMLKAMGIEEEKIDQIIEAHTETVDALKSESDGLKDKAQQYDNVKKELDELKKQPPEDWKEKHDKVKQEFDTFKADLAKKEALTAKKAAFNGVLDSIGIEDAVVRENAVMKADFEKIELDGDKIKDAEKLVESLKAQYASYIPSGGSKGSHVEHPPKNTGGKKTKDDIYKKDENGRYVLSASERQAALAESLR